GRKTGGLLQAKVSSVETDTLVQHQLDLIAPALHWYRERLLTAEHQKDRYYPVVVNAECFAADPNAPPFQLDRRHGELKSLVSGLGLFGETAATEEEFVELVRKVLQSTVVRSLIQSLIARINETASPKAPDNNQGGGKPPSQNLDDQGTPARSEDR